MKLKNIIIIAATVSLLYACTGIRHNVLVQGKDPEQRWNYNLWFQRNDLEALGVVKDSIEYTNYFGLINSHKDYRVTKRVEYPGFSGINVNNGIFGDYTGRVLYKLYEKSPDADIIIPTKIIRKKQILFLGSRRSIVIVGKAYKLK
jgi:hypothetical protein